MPSTLTFAIGLAAAFLLAMKVIIHKQIDKKNDRMEKSSIPFATNPMLILPYFQSVTHETKNKRLLCNIIWSIAVSLIISIVLFGTT